MKFTTTRTVRFCDCDPAGIVFYPQYMVMLNTLAEVWFDEALHIPYALLIGERRTGLPTVRLEVDFTAISRHGEVLALSVEIEKLGRSSLTLVAEFRGAANDELRLRARQVLVCTSLATHKAQPLPDDVRAALSPYVSAARI
jgi:4-hydroxybenzoyl-CoA thioesterase